MIAAIRAEVPEYARPLEGSFGRGVRAGVGEALTRFVNDIESPAADPAPWERVYFELGRGEVWQGRSLESLLAAYRVGARVSWRQLAEVATEAGAGGGELTALAEAIFAYIDEISAISAEGFAAAQAEAAGELQRRREALVATLLDASASADSLAEAAEAADWALPGAAAIALVADTAAPGAVATSVGQGAIAVALEPGLICAIVPDPEAPGRQRQLRAALAGSPAAIGMPASPERLSGGLGRVRLAMRLRAAGVFAESPVFIAEHRATLLVHSDGELLAEHAARELAPLADETDLSRARLLETLRAWLDHPGRPTEVARAVHIHPQTARYRLRRLRELLGDIDTPERRFDLDLALRASY